MKKIVLFVLLSMMAVTATFAQEAAFTQAVAKFKSAKTATANVTMTQHNAALTKNTTATGSLYMKDPDKVCISVNGGKDQLVMNGNTFTMVMKGRKHVANSKISAQFATFKSVFYSVLSGGKSYISKLSGVSVAQSGHNVLVTIVPVAANAKEKRRMMFSSFELVINKSTNALVSLSMKDRRGGYTKYAFTGFRFGGSVNDKVFNP